MKKSSKGDFMREQTIKYKALVGEKALSLYYYDNNLWSTLNSISELFNCSIQDVYVAIQKINKKDKIKIDKFNQYLEIRLDSGVRSRGNFYSLEIILAVGYILNPKIAIKFYKSVLSLYQNKSKTTLLPSMFGAFKST